MSAGGGGGSTVSTTLNYSPEETARRTRVQDEAENIYKRIAPNVAGAPYPGSVPIGPSGATQAAWQSLYGAAPRMENVSRGAEYSLLRGLDPSMMYAESNPYLQSAIGSMSQNVLDQLNDAGGTLSGIRTEAQGQGGFGTNTRQGIAEGLAASRANRDIGQIAAEMSYKNYLDTMQNQTRLMALAPGVQGMATAPGQVYGAVGTQQEGYGQAANDYEAATRAWELEREWGPLQNWANIVFGGGSSQSTAMSQSPQAKSNPALGAMGGGAMGYGMSQMLPASMAGPAAIPMAVIGALLGAFG